MNHFTPHIASILETKVSFLQAPTGTGKSTYFPIELIKLTTKKMILVQPRRAAARLLAHRMARLMNERVGATVGYHVRHENHFSSQTQILVVTEGILLRRLQNDPFLDGFSIVVLDEFHERSAQLDLLLMLLQDVQSAREDLRLILCSATLDIINLKHYFSDAYVAEIQAPAFPIEISYLTEPSQENPEELAIRAALKIVKSGCQGHILIFMPGVAEIRTCIDRLEQQTDLSVFPLHGGLGISETQAALAPSASPKIVVSTNIAESSVTIPNVQYVIDSGLERIAVQDQLRTKLKTQRITLASAQQRAGRAGRTTKGNVIRLWTQPAENQFRTHQEPEICRTDLLPILLAIYQWGTTPETLQWLTPPNKGSVKKAIFELSELELVQSNRLTTLGEMVAQLPLPPKLAVFLIKSDIAGCGGTACALATLMTEKDPWPKTSRLSFWEKVCALERDNLPSGAKRLKRIYRQLIDLLPKIEKNLGGDNEAKVCSLFMSIFPEDTGYRLGLNTVKLGNGQKARIAERADRETPYFLAISVSQRDNRQPYVHQYHPVEPEWIPTKETIQHHYDSELEQVVATLEERIGALVINSHECPVDVEKAQHLLFKAARTNPLSFLNITQECQHWINRIRFWARHHPNEEIDCFEDWTELLRVWTSGKSRRKELLNMSVLSEIKQKTPWRIQNKLNSDVPDFFTAPSGARIRIQYNLNSPPEVAARIQQLFGLKQTPLILGVPMRITLLAPNQRPQQQTQDMASFWKNTYPELRKELRGRYSKHAWPENPTKYDAENRPKRKKRN